MFDKQAHKHTKENPKDYCKEEDKDLFSAALESRTRSNGFKPQERDSGRQTERNPS